MARGDGSGAPETQVPGGGRTASVAALLEGLWGAELPPGAAPWSRVAADVVALDDAHGRDAGLTVQGDALSTDTFAELLSYVPHDAPIRAALTPALLERATRGRAVDGRTSE